MAGWWQQLKADAEAVNCADASEHQAASNTGSPPVVTARPGHEPAVRFQAGAADEPRE